MQTQTIENTVTTQSNGSAKGKNKKKAKVGGIAADQLKSLVERIENLEEEKAARGADIKEVYAEAKMAGYDTKAIRNCVRERKMDASDRQEQYELFDLYRRALDMI